MNHHKWMDDRLRLALLKESAAYRAFWEETGRHFLSACAETSRKDNDSPLITNHISDEFFTKLYNFKIRMTLGRDRKDGFVKKILALDPFNDEELPDPLPVYFYDHLSPIKHVVCELPGSTWRDCPHEDSLASLGKPDPVQRPRPRIDLGVLNRKGLQPNERLLVVDISRRRGEIIAEMEAFLDRVSEFRKHNDNPWAENYAKWKPETERQRGETWQALKVWKLRRRKTPFLAIKKETGLSVPAAKKAFARAYELIESRHYDREQFKKVYQEIQSAEVKRTCKTCPERDTCTDLCPDVLAFINQDQVGLPELLSPR